jgi:hypothetical protein
MGVKPVEARLHCERSCISCGGMRGDGLVVDFNQSRQVGEGGNAECGHKIV